MNDGQVARESQGAPSYQHDLIMMIYKCMYVCICMCVYVCLFVYVCICMCVCVCIYLPTPPYKQDAMHNQFFKLNLTGLNLEFSFSSTGCRDQG